MLWFVGVAVVGALCRGLGAAMQERDAVRAPGRRVARFGLLVYLARRPRWLAGIAIAGAGVALHLAALGGAPLTVIQPLAVSGLVFAIAVAAAFNRRRVSGRELCAGLAVAGGLAGLLAAFPGESPAPVLGAAAALALGGAAAAVGLAALTAARHLAAGPRALVLAGAAGLALGTASAFVRVIGHGILGEASAATAWLVPIALGGMALAGLLLQNAFRTGQFAASYSAFLLCEAATGVGIGAAVLGEAMPLTPAAQAGAVAAAVCAVAGTIALARPLPQPRRIGCGRPPPGNATYERGNDSAGNALLPGPAR